MAQSNTPIPKNLTDQEIKDIAIQRVLANLVSRAWKWNQDEPEATVEFLGHIGIASASSGGYVGEVISKSWPYDKKDREVSMAFNLMHKAFDWIQATIAIRVLNDAIIQVNALM